MLIQYYIQKPWIAILIHVILGVVAREFPELFVLYYLGVIGLGVAEIAFRKDDQNLAAYYATYLVMMEIIYRVAGFTLLHELGKYSIIMIVGTALLFQRNGMKAFYSPFLLYLVLFLPGIFMALIYSFNEELSFYQFRKYLLFNFSGPLCLGLTGLYFYRREFSEAGLRQLIFIGLLPCLTFLILLSLHSSGFTTYEFDKVGSVFDTSGGFGPNQVSTMLGWGIVLMGFALIHQMRITPYVWLDVLIFAWLIFRCFLTFSRGGMMGSIGSLAAAFFIMIFFSQFYQNKFKNLFPRLVVGAIMLSIVAVIVNYQTNNFLYYRYMGVSTYELKTGIAIEKSYLTGREDIIMKELEMMAEYPWLGLGIGSGWTYREKKQGGSVAPHTEFSRMLSEQGIFGLLILVIIFIFFPIFQFLQNNVPKTRFWLLLFFFLSMLTMFHNAMRLAMPAVAFGIAFLLIRKEKNH